MGHYSELTIFRAVWPCPNSTHVLFSFFFQAEDGIRDDLVTGVQTCALPISDASHPHRRFHLRTRWLAIDEDAAGHEGETHWVLVAGQDGAQHTREREGETSRRSEERRVGKECRSRWSP